MCRSNRRGSLPSKPTRPRSRKRGAVTGDLHRGSTEADANAAPNGWAARHELWSAAILAVATILTAWAAFQAASWVRIQTRESAAASATRVESTRASNQAAATNGVDVTLWTAWVNAALAEQRQEPGVTINSQGQYFPVPGSDSAFYYARFRKEFRPAFNAWLAYKPFTNPQAPPAPFALPQYQLASLHTADRLDRQTQLEAARATDAGNWAGDYAMLTVVFASALAFAGLSVRLRGQRVRSVTLSVATVVLISAVGFSAAIPIHL